MPRAKQPKLSENAQAIYDAHAGGDWISWATLKETLQAVDPLIIATAWNELVTAGLASGELSKGYTGKVYSEPRE